MRIPSVHEHQGYALGNPISPDIDQPLAYHFTSFDSDRTLLPANYR